MDRLPLIPTDYSSVCEALQNFNMVFESRYGGLHPRFSAVPLSQVISEAFDLPKSRIQDRKPLAIYLHNDDAVACNIFPYQVLCTDAICSLLNCQFVNWAWDMTQDDNRKKFYQYLSENSMSEVKEAVQLTSIDSYPLLVLITKDRSSIMVSNIIHGPDDPDGVMEKIISCMDDFHNLKNKEILEERNRLEREQIRQEQVDEYERSKAIDRAKQEELRRQREEEMNEQRRIQEEHEARLRHQAELASTIPEEPDVNTADIITIRIRFPNGGQKIRRFRMSETLKWLICYIESLGYDMKSHRIWTSDMPRRDLSTYQINQSFSDLKWTPREQITVEEK